MSSDVDPSHEILLVQTFSVKELVKVDCRVSRKMLIPHGAGRVLVVLAFGDCYVMAGPVRIAEGSRGSSDGLRNHLVPTRSVGNVYLQRG